MNLKKYQGHRDRSLVVIRQVLLFSVFFLVFAQGAMAQTAFSPWQNRSQAKSPSNWRKNTAIILFSGIGGSLIGLSTLSFLW